MRCCHAIFLQIYIVEQINLWSVLSPFPLMLKTESSYSIFLLFLNSWFLIPGTKCSVLNYILFYKNIFYVVVLTFKFNFMLL
jgi:hypothetical protein